MPRAAKKTTTPKDDVPSTCPFCGKRPKTLVITKDGVFTQIRCGNGRCAAQPFVGAHDERGEAASRRAAIRRWNKRAPRGGYAE